jgi:hypothetical protein
MKPWDRPPFACPFCHGRAVRVALAQKRSESGLIERVVGLMVLELAFWPIALTLLLLALWSLVAASLILFGGVALCVFWERRQATYRCEACQTVLASKEVKRASELEA